MLHIIWTALSITTSYVQEEGYEKALACNGEQCDGQTLKVVKCRPNPKERAAMQAARAQQAQQPAQPAQHAQQPAQQRPQYAPPPRYEAQEQAAEQPAQQQWQQRERAPAGGAQGGDGGQRRQHSGPAPKTPGYHVAYVGEQFAEHLVWCERIACGVLCSRHRG